MLKNHFKIAFRTLIRRRTFSLINILGLTLGIAACSIIYLYVSYEKSYDTFHENADNIYRLKNIRYYASGTDSSTGCVALLGPTLKEEIPEVVNFARVRRASAVVTAMHAAFFEEDMFWADSSLLTMFSFPLISGEPKNVLSRKFTAVLTESTAKKYFGNKNALGETIQFDGMTFTITGIAKDVPPNSHMHFNILLSFNTQLTDRFCWGCNNNNTYIQVASGTSQSVIESKLPSIVNKLHDSKENGFERAYFLQPLKDIHLHSNLRFELEVNGNAEAVYFMSIMAVIILLIAWINYINLSTARSLERAKEVGLRKTVGAGFWTLVRQFLIESLVINSIAICCAYFLVEITYPLWNEVIGMPASFSLWNNPGLLILLAALVFVSPLIAGIYPSVVLSTYKPASILKGSFKNSAKGILLRQGLVVVQFAVSIILIAVVIIFGRQLSFMQNKNLGFNINQKLVLNVPANIKEGEDRTSVCNTFINELRNQSLIEDAAYSSIVPGMENGDITGGVRYGKQSIEDGKQMYFVYVSENYLDFFNIDLVSGRNFFDSELNGLYQNDSEQALLINESALKTFGFTSPGEALNVDILQDKNRIGKVIGVIKDYHQQSLDKEIKPAIFKAVTRGNYFIFNMNTADISKRIDGIKELYAEMFPGNPFEYNFLDEFFNRQYMSNIQTAKIVGMFTFLSIFISCLGLIGLSSLMAIQKTKEIGIRKVLGAYIHSILFLLSKQFIKLVLISNLIAYPVIYFIMSRWLQNFAYRIDISWWIFVLSGSIALAIAFIAVSFNTLKAASANPVESLRCE